jgi:hypothetical protein
VLGLGLALTTTPAAAQLLPDDAHRKAARHEEVRAATVVVVTGSADHMDQVLRRAKVKFVVVRPEELPELPLNSRQVLMVNCRGVMSQLARDRVRRFVAAGGFLYTTDHAVHELVERAFPGTIAWNRKTTQQEVYPMTVHGEASRRGLLKHLGSDAGERWQVAGGGYLFDVLDKHKVEVLMESKEVARRYGGSGVLGVRFRHDDGFVIHVTGHFYSQPGQQPGVASAGQAFEQLSKNVVMEKQADQARIGGLYNVAPKREVLLQAAPAPSAPAVSPTSVTTQKIGVKARVRVLERKGSHVKVRDDQGNEGWVDKNAL